MIAEIVREVLASAEWAEFLAVVKASYFADCDRDEHGHCRPGGGGGKPGSKPGPGTSDKPGTEKPSQEHPDPETFLTDFASGADYTPDETEAIQDYGISLHNSVNRFHRGLSEPGPGERARIERLTKQLDAALEKSSLPEAVTVYRGVGKDQAMKEGDSVSDKGYFSTSLSKDFAAKAAGKDGQVIEMNLPKGAKALPVGGMPGTVPGEHELLLPRGTSFNVESVDGNTVKVSAPGESESESEGEGEGAGDERDQLALDKKRDREDELADAARDDEEAKFETKHDKERERAIAKLGDKHEAELDDVADEDRRALTARQNAEFDALEEQFKKRRDAYYASQQAKYDAEDRKRDTIREREDLAREGR